MATYEIPGGPKAYQPANPHDTTGQRVVTEQVVLLTREADLKARARVEDLAAFIKAAEVVAYKELDRNKTAMAVMIQFNCLPGQYEVKMASQGEAEQEVVQQVYEKVSDLPPRKVAGDFRFKVQMRVRC